MQSFSLREQKGRGVTGFDGPRDIEATRSCIAREEVQFCSSATCSKCLHVYIHRFNIDFYMTLVRIGEENARR